MRAILHLKHWQIFSLLMLIMLIGNIDLKGMDQLTMAFSTTGIILYLMVLLMYGHALYTYLPKHISFNYNLFLISSFVYAVAISTITILYNTDNFHQTAFYILPFVLAAAALLYAISFPARILRSLELNRKVQFGEYTMLVLSIIFWPFCIWFIQPRINKIVAEHPLAFESISN